MAKNLIPEIAKMLGVELGEEFKIKGYDGLTYKLTDNGLELTTVDGQKTKWFDNGALNSLLKGKMEIVKLPWKPKKGETYYTFELLGGKWIVHLLWWTGSPNGYALLEKGWVYRTQKEAEAALPAVAAELGVEYKL
jgi:hypothetical protein|nr:MAG TPA: hypothetical protein [Caudoviricetes sp.]